MSLNIAALRAEFPILGTRVNGHPLIYLDNAATTQLPIPVLDAINTHYRLCNGNVHRGIHHLSELSTRHMEDARERVRAFVGAQETGEIVFTGGTTDGINLLAEAYCSAFVGEGDEILVSEMEHHSNFVPWQLQCQKRRAAFRVIPLTSEGELNLGAMEALLSPRTRLVAVTQVSNVLGTVNRVEVVVRAAHARGIPVLVDGAQGIRHHLGGVQDLGCDFYCFSGHKLLAPTGIGVLYVKKDWIPRLEPPRTGGGMVDTVTLRSTSFQSDMHRFEAGTPNYAGAIALGSALEYLSVLGTENAAVYESSLLTYAEETLLRIPGVTVLGHPTRRAGCVSFTVGGLHPFDLAAFLDLSGVAVRAGSHCAQPLHARYGLAGSVRVSPAFYNTPEEIDDMAAALKRAIRTLERGKGR